MRPPRVLSPSAVTQVADAMTTIPVRVSTAMMDQVAASELGMSMSTEVAMTAASPGETEHFCLLSGPGSTLQSPVYVGSLPRREGERVHQDPSGVGFGQVHPAGEWGRMGPATAKRRGPGALCEYFRTRRTSP